MNNYVTLKILFKINTHTDIVTGNGERLITKTSTNENNLYTAIQANDELII